MSEHFAGIIERLVVVCIALSPCSIKLRPTLPPFVDHIVMAFMSSVQRVYGHSYLRLSTHMCPKSFA